LKAVEYLGEVPAPPAAQPTSGPPQSPTRNTNIGSE